jgi:hypothetical protein
MKRKIKVRIKYEPEYEDENSEINVKADKNVKILFGSREIIISQDGKNKNRLIIWSEDDEIVINDISSDNKLVSDQFFITVKKD